MAITILRPCLPSYSHCLFPYMPSKKRRGVSCAALEVSDTVSKGPELSLSVGSHVIPHPKKVEKGGEDAFFVSSYKGGVIAVADGVSGWAEKDVDPARFSRQFITYASTFVEDEEVNFDPRSLIKKAHAATSCIGSATVIVAMLETTGILKIANVGDCGLRVVRKGQLIFSTCPQEHYFDCPYQLSSEDVSQTYLDATVTTVELVNGDTIIMGSDGLFDNVFDSEVVSTLATHPNVADAAKALADLAHKHSKDMGFDSPHSQEARIKGIELPSWKQYLGMKLTGGKLDDITVIVAQAKAL